MLNKLFALFAIELYYANIWGRLRPPKLFIMRYVYVLMSQKDNQLYVGSTYDLEKRLNEHNSGRVPATKHRTPFEVIHYEMFSNKYDAYIREKWLKTGWGRRYLRKTLHNMIKSLGG